MSLPGKQKNRATFQHAESILVLGFLAVILLGTVLLALPAASADGKSIGLFDSLFTSTSAVCVTGLVVVDTGTTFSLFGQIVLLILIQTGGLGFMVFATMCEAKQNPLLHSLSQNDIILHNVCRCSTE